MKKIKKVCILFILSIIIFINNSFANSEIEIISNNTTIETNEQIQINIELKDVNVASFIIEILWDATKLEYLEGPENSNYINNRILYTWVSDKGINVNNVITEKFTFKAIKDGIANIVVTGEFYDINGDEVKIDDNHLEINIEDKTSEQTKQSNTSTKEKVSSNNTELSILRLNHEGISPQFDSSILEYYFIVDKEISNLEVTAIPKNENSTVTTTGNQQLKMGKNTISINVESEDKTQNTTYKIYVTRTDDIEKANADLETLAIKQSDLNPEFNNNVTHYTAEIANNIDKIDILAIPLKEKASVQILGNEEMNIGNNIIQVIVEAEDGVTAKKYQIIVHRRNEEEEIQYQEEQKVQIEKLSNILEEKNEEQQEDITQEEKRKNEIIIAIIIVIILIIVVTTIMIRKKHNLTKEL